MTDCWPTWRCRCVCPLALESRGVPGWQGWRLLRSFPFLLQGRAWIPDKRGNSGSVLASNSCGKCILCHGSWDSGMLRKYGSVQLSLLCQYLSSISNKLLPLFSQVPQGLSPGAHALVQPCQPLVGPVLPSSLANRPHRIKINASLQQQKRCHVGHPAATLGRSTGSQREGAGEGLGFHPGSTASQGGLCVCANVFCCKHASENTGRGVSAGKQSRMFLKEAGLHVWDVVLPPCGAPVLPQACGARSQPGAGAPAQGKFGSAASGHQARRVPGTQGDRRVAHGLTGSPSIRSRKMQTES